MVFLFAILLLRTTEYITLLVHYRSQEWTRKAKENSCHTDMNITQVNEPCGLGAMMGGVNNTVESFEIKGEEREFVVTNEDFK